MPPEVLSQVGTSQKCIVGTNLLYTPSTNFHGTNVMAYVITDGNGGSATGLVTVVVTPVNDAPVAIDDSDTTPEDMPVTVSVLTNDFDVDGDSLTITNAVTTNGTVTFTGTNVTYTWDFGDGSAAYGASTVHTYTEVGEYSVTVTATNSAGSVQDTLIVIVAAPPRLTYLPLIRK